MTIVTTKKPATTRATTRHSVRFAPTRRPVVAVSPAPQVAHPFAHGDDDRTRCPACELRQYLDG
jgi:hypothetical protein